MKLTPALHATSALHGLTLIMALAMPLAAAADGVTLRSQDGTINITGDLISFEDNTYLIRTALGDLRLSAERVSCVDGACPVFAPVEAKVTFAGSDTVGFGVLPLILEGYAGYLDAESTVVATDGGTSVVANFVSESGFGEDIGSYLVTTSSSNDAFDRLLRRDAEIGMSSRRIRPDEVRALSDAGAGNMVGPDQEHIVAIDSLVVITHPDNPVSEISMDDLAGIYRGQITNWSQVGGPDLPIKVIDRPDDSGTQSVFVQNVLGGDARSSAVRTLAADNTEMATLVNSDIGAIGYTGYAFQRGAKAVSLVNECGIAMRPDPFSARTEEYPLQRRLYLYTRADNTSEATEAFLDFALSEDADGLISKAGFIDLGVDRRSQGLDSERSLLLRAAAVPGALERRVTGEMLDLMSTHDRLSTTFRFRTGSSELDERAIVDMKRLVTYLEDYPGAKLKIVGFTDEVGKFENNQILAQNRAAQVKAQFEAFAGNRLNGIEIETVAFGEIAPSACNGTDAGRAINRRVEVWIEQAG